jgi:hypothetical protein
MLKKDKNKNNQITDEYKKDDLHNKNEDIKNNQNDNGFNNSGQIKPEDLKLDFKKNNEETKKQENEISKTETNRDGTGPQDPLRQALKPKRGGFHIQRITLHIWRIRRQ